MNKIVTQYVYVQPKHKAGDISLHLYINMLATNHDK